MGSIYRDLGVSLRWELETGAGRGVWAEPSSSYVIGSRPAASPGQDPESPTVHISILLLLLPAGYARLDEVHGSGPVLGLSPDPWPLRRRRKRRKMRNWSCGCGLTACRRWSTPAASQVSAPTWQSPVHSAGRAPPCRGQPCSASPLCGQRQLLSRGAPGQATHHTHLHLFWHPLLADVLGATAVLMLKGRQDQLVAFKAALLHAGERQCGRIPPFRDEHDEGQGLQRALEQSLWECMGPVRAAPTCGCLLTATHPSTTPLPQSETPWHP